MGKYNSNLKIGADFNFLFAINETDTLAGTSQEFIAPRAGRMEELGVVVQKTVTTGGPVTVKINGVAVAGLTITVADGATKGTRYTDSAPTIPSATRTFAKGDRIEVVPDAAFATAGAISGYVGYSASRNERIPTNDT